MSVFACSKSSDSKEDSNPLIGTYRLEKTGTNHYEKGKIVKRDISTEKINGEMTLLADKSFRIVFVADGESEVAIGTYNSVNQTFTIQQGGDFKKTSYFFEDNYLVLITEDNGDSKDVGYFKKK
ncbi:hypothetical protein KO02_23350 [Sphingobacterium sp. ML3W]|nr:hypothetical protein KO02_23350 [Sphingobacterium sp. ML3W]